MGQDIGLGGALVEAWRPSEPDQAFQALESELDAPAQTVEGKDILGREVFGRERRRQDDPFRRRQRSVGNPMTMLARLPARPSPRRFGGRPRLLDRDQP